MIVWRGVDPAAEVQCAAGVLAEIAQLAMNGYRRYPWGGVEVGGVLFGKTESGTVHISSFRQAVCEHHYGPAFDLSEKDYDAFEHLLVDAETDEELNGLVPIGWYQTISRRDSGLSDQARAFFHRFFPEPWQVAMVVKRSKQDPFSIGIFVHDSQGRAEMHSPAQEFMLEELRQRHSRPMVPETAAQERETASSAAERVPEAPPQPAAGLTEAASTSPDTPFPFLGLVVDPFSAHPDAQFFYPSPQHREALAILFHQIRSRAGFLALIGEPGTGKSIVLECLRDLLHAHADFAFLLNSNVTVSEFFELIAHGFHLSCTSATKTATLIALNERLLARLRAGLTTALIIDSAEKLSTEVLEEIELMGNFENRDGRLLQVVFAAQPGLDRQLDTPELRGLKQRLLLKARLEPLDATQTAAYIEHRMAAAGTRGQTIFPADVLAEIHRRTLGVPRLVNALCGRLLANCRELQVKTVEMSMLERMQDEFVLDARGRIAKQGE